MFQIFSNYRQHYTATFADLLVANEKFCSEWLRNKPKLSSLLIRTEEEEEMAFENTATPQLFLCVFQEIFGC